MFEPFRQKKNSNILKGPYYKCTCQNADESRRNNNGRKNELFKRNPRIKKNNNM